MNKLITTATGGFPYVLDDIRWEMDAYRQAFSDLACAIRNSNTADSILWGCEVTDNGADYDVTAGAAIINGELFYVAAATGITKVALQRLCIQASTSTFDSAGLKTFQDASVNNTYNIRVANVVMTATAGLIELSTAGASSKPVKRDEVFHNYLGSATKIELGDTTIDSTGSYYSTNSIVAASDPVVFYKVGNEVKVYGGFSQSPATSTTARLKVGSLPSGYRPTSSVILNGYAANNAGAGRHVVFFEIDSSGDIWVLGDVFNTMFGTGVTFNATTGIIINGSFTI